MSGWVFRAALFAVSTLTASAQCSMCREAAAMQQAEAAAALNQAILVLAAPVALSLAGLGVLLRRAVRGDRSLSEVDRREQLRRSSS